jgi:hypothetical protein
MEVVEMGGGRTFTRTGLVGGRTKQRDRGPGISFRVVHGNNNNNNNNHNHKHNNNNNHNRNNNNNNNNHNHNNNPMIGRRRMASVTGGSSAGTALSSRIITLDEDFGQYFAVVEIGTPAIEAALILDTGSQLLWVQCQPCVQCGVQANYQSPIAPHIRPNLMRSIDRSIDRSC